MTTWTPAATLATFLTLEDIVEASRTDDKEYETPVLKLVVDARAKGYDVVCLPLTTDKWKTRWSDMCLEDSEKDKEAAAKAAEAWRSNPAFRDDEVTITRLDEAEGLTVMISEWLELDTPDDWIRHDAEIALRQELAYASYLNIQTVILPAPRNRDHVASYARIVNTCLKNNPYVYFSVRLPIYNPSIFHQASTPLSSDHPASPSIPVQLSSPQTPIKTPKLVISSAAHGKLAKSSEGELNATWEMWDLIRSICDYNPRLTLTLDLTPALPSRLGVLNKWAAESVRHIFLPSSTFIANMKGYPVLPKPTQNFIRDSMIHRPTVMFSGVSSGNHSRGGEAAYTQYVKHLERTSTVVQAAQREGTVENFAQGYQDYLQAPLQPLMDNLQSVTYHTFEQDPVKYSQYEEAMYRAFMDKPADHNIVVCVAGAGRGPLVARCIKALERSHRNASIFAIEKNPNAYVTLQHRKKNEWQDKVLLIFGDMRTVELPEKVDILVSELLGSFGDNELSPECLDGAMRFLKDDGISIPSSYTAHLAPLSSSKLYNEARASNNPKSLETPYVVMFQAVNILSGESSDGRCGPQIQECWEFEHPRSEPILDERGFPLTNSHNARSAKLRILHGLAGYFEAVLYGSVGLSIHPNRKDRISKDMLSWFPLFFPFREPLYLPSNSELQVTIWRLTTERQVWYEWHAESFLSIAVTIPVSDDRSQSNRYSSASSFSGFVPPSPLADVMDTFSEPSAIEGDKEHDEVTYEIVKIGHTSLHNPGGRSSWIGV
ncbi:PRMT5-domain-containing protein [Cyathus striatus]|nr:PRMT5-domain-containing protein [Cyathus striatus]